jgi:hypothetical protein
VFQLRLRDTVKQNVMILFQMTGNRDGHRDIMVVAERSRPFLKEPG